MTYPYLHVKESRLGALIGRLAGAGLRAAGTGARAAKDFTFAPRVPIRARMPNLSSAARAGSVAKNVVKPFTRLGTATAVGTAGAKGYQFYDRTQTNRNEISSQLQDQGMDPEKADDLAYKATWGALGNTAMHVGGNLPYYLGEGARSNPIDAGLAASVFGSGSPLPNNAAAGIRQAGSLFTSSPTGAVTNSLLYGGLNAAGNMIQNMPQAFQQYGANMRQNFRERPLQTGADMYRSRYMGSMREYLGNDFSRVAPIIAARAGKSASVLSATPALDNRNKIIGGILGTLLGGGIGAGVTAPSGGVGALPGGLLGAIIGMRLGQISDNSRIHKELKGKTLFDYKPTADELKAKGFSEDEIHDLLYAPMFAQSEKQALDVYDKEHAIFRPVSATIGRVLSMPAMDILGTAHETASLDNPDIKAYLDAVKDHSALKDVGVYLGSERLLNKLYRTWKNPRYGFGSKIMSTLNFPIRALSAATGRADHYDPTSNTISVFHSDPAILAHELGHAMDFGTAKDPDLANRMYQRKSPLDQEYLASNMAINAFAKQMFNKSKDVSPEDLKKLKDNALKLRRAYNTYDQWFRERGVQKEIRELLDSNPNNNLSVFMTDPKLAPKLKKLLAKHKNA